MGQFDLRGNASDAPLSSLALGDVELTYLPDGIHHVEADKQFPTTPHGLWEKHQEVFDPAGLLVMSIGSVLIRTSEHNVLVDLGFGPRSIDLDDLTGGAFKGDLVGGQLLDSLVSVGLTPADIDVVIFSHLHVDHVGWLEDPQRPGELTFGRARIVTHKAEWEHWSQPENIALEAGASAEQIEILRPRVETPGEDIEVVPGVTLVHTPGHTPGHLSVLVTGSAGRALVLGDALHCPVELQHPGQSFVFDIEPEAAAASRRAIYEILTAPDTWFAGGHFPDRVFGRAESTSGGNHHLTWCH